MTPSSFLTIQARLAGCLWEAQFILPKQVRQSRSLSRCFEHTKLLMLLVLECLFIDVFLYRARFDPRVQSTCPTHKLLTRSSCACNTLLGATIIFTRNRFSSSCSWERCSSASDQRVASTLHRTVELRLLVYDNEDLRCRCWEGQHARKGRGLSNGLVKLSGLTFTLLRQSTKTSLWVTISMSSMPL